MKLPVKYNFEESQEKNQFLVHSSCPDVIEKLRELAQIEFLIAQESKLKKSEIKKKNEQKNNNLR